MLRELGSFTRGKASGLGWGAGWAWLPGRPRAGRQAGRGWKFLEGQPGQAGPAASGLPTQGSCPACQSWGIRGTSWHMQGWGRQAGGGSSAGLGLGGLTDGRRGQRPAHLGPRSRTSRPRGRGGGPTVRGGVRPQGPSGREPPAVWAGASGPTQQVRTSETWLSLPELDTPTASIQKQSMGRGPGAMPT